MNVINSAIEEGVSTIVENHPRFDQKYILKHIDNKILKDKIEEIYRNMDEGKKRFSARKKLKGEKYLDDVVGAFQDLYSLFKTGDYARRMPEVAGAVTTVYNMGFLDPAVDVLKHYNLIGKRGYNVLKKNIRKETERGVEEAVSGIERYAGYQKVAASILGIFGILILISSALFLINFKKLPLRLSKLKIFKN